jgi:glutamate-1-semialdehyde 2,1-aminomutase
MTNDAWLKTYANQRPKCGDLYARAKSCLAGHVGHDMRHSVPFPSYAQRACGSRLWDVDGNEAIDYGMGNGALLLGHAPPDVLKAVGEALARGFHFGYDHPAQIEWASLIQTLIPSAERVRFVSSGTEGTMLALRLARAFTGRDKVLRFEGHFNGWHDYVGVGTSPPFDAPVSMGIPKPTLETIVVIPADLDTLEATLRHDSDIASVMLEPSGASWGTVPLSVAFNRELRRLTAERGVLLIYDEVVTGFRYGPGGYQEFADVCPDLTVLGKIATGGMPGAVLVGRADIMQLFDFTEDAEHDRYGRVQHLGTFNANPLSAAAGLATLKRAATGEPQAHADRMAAMLRAGMEGIMDQEGAAGYVYGDSSTFHVYLEAYPGTGESSRDTLHTDDAAVLKGIPRTVVSAFQKNLQIRGVDLLSYTGGVTSASHTEADVRQTLGVFGETIRALVSAQVIGRVG